MKPREKFGKIRVGIALALFFACALISSFGGTASVPSNNATPARSEGEAVGTIVSIGPAQQALPSECAIVATEALHRLARSAAWARLFQIDGTFPDGNRYSHMLAVWQVRSGSSILIYDNFLIHGTAELDTKARDPGAIAFALAMRFQFPIYSARFVK